MPPRLIPRSWTLLPGVNSRSAGAMVTKPACSSSLGDEPERSCNLGDEPACTAPVLAILFRWCDTKSRCASNSTNHEHACARIRAHSFFACVVGCDRRAMCDTIT